MPPDAARANDRPEDQTTAAPASLPEGGDDLLVFPTTVGQKRFWSLDAFNPGNPALNMPLAARLVGRVDRAVLQQAVNEIMRRHEILRSRFEMEGDELVQVLCPTTGVSIRWIECSDTPAERIAGRTQGVMLEEAALPFRLDKGPFLRGALASFSSTEHVLMLTMHHIVSDGWSNGIVIREFAENYTRILRRESPPYDELPLQYADYAVWQRDWVTSAEGIAQRDFWKSELGEELPVLNLPTDFPRGRKISSNGTIASRLLPTTLSENFRSVCQQEDATPFMGYLATYVALLHRYSAQEEFVVGSPAACRYQTELEGMIGLFANPLLIRVRVRPELTFRQLLHHVRDTTLNVLARQEYPFELVAEQVRAEESRRGVAWLQAYFVFQKAFMQPQQMPGLELSPLRSVTAGSVFEWFLGPVERKEGVRLQLEYNSDLFAATTIERAMRYAEMLVETAVRNVDFKIGDLEFDPDLEFISKHQEAITDSRSLLSAISSSFSNDGSAVLIEEGETHLTLRTLKEHAARIQRLLTILSNGIARIGVRAESVALAAANSVAVLEAGHSAVLVTHTSGQEQLDGYISGTLEHPVFTPAARAKRDPESTPGLVLRNDFNDDTETSISAIELRNHSTALAAALQLTPRDRVAVLTRLDTLLGWEELVASWLGGARVQVNTASFSPPTKPTVILLGTAQATLLIREDRERLLSVLRSARLLALDRDSVPPVLVKLIREHVGSALSVVQRFQPTEIGLTVTISSVLPSTGQKSSAPHTQVVAGWGVDVVDQRGVRTPRGAPGRLRVFRISARSTTPVVTSDIVRTRDQALEWIAQSQDMAGPRSPVLELKELRELACTHSSVEAAWPVVISVAGKSVLTLHVLPSAGTALKARELKAFIEERVPTYVVPGVVVVHTRVPVDRSGRIDFCSLRANKWTREAAEPIKAAEQSVAGGATPVGEIEEKLAEIFSELLRTPSVDVRKSFFDLGGHSLLGVRLFARIEKTFKQRLPLAALLASPSVRGLAKRIDTLGTGPRRWPCLVPVQTAGNGAKFFCVHGAGGNILLYRDLARRMAPAVRFYGLQAQGLDGQSACLTRVEDMAELYLNEILQEQPSGPYFIGGYCMGGNIAYEIGQLLLRKGHEVGFVAMLDSYNLRRSLYTGTPTHRLRIVLQKASFHLDTLIHLNMGERKKYLSEKMRMAGELVQGKTRAAKTKHIKSSDEAGAQEVAFVQNANHVALKAHQPQPFAGNLLLLRPRKNYFTFPDPKMGWGELATGRLETVELPANPHAMLLEPFVRYLAERLTERMSPTLTQQVPEEAEYLTATPQGSTN